MKTVYILLPLGAYLALVVVFWKAGLIGNAHDVAEPTLSTAFAFLGAAMTATVTLAGVLLKMHFDQRSHALRQEAEDRLRMETALTAVDMIVDESEKGAVRNGGALIALASLGQAELALALLDGLWKQGRVDAEGACSVVDYALQSGDDASEDHAVAILNSNVRRLPSGDGNCAFPKSVMQAWPTRVKYLTRLTLLHCLGKMLVSRPRAHWEDMVLNAMVMHINEARTADPDQRIQDAASAMLLPLLHSLYTDTKTIDNESESDRISVKDLKASIASAVPNLKLSDQMIELVRQLERWTADKPLTS